MRNVCLALCLAFLGAACGNAGEKMQSDPDEIACDSSTEMACAVGPQCMDDPADLCPGDIPQCIKAMVDKAASGPVEDRPRAVIEYTYKESTVYYVEPQCCGDAESTLFDAQCKVICAPDGGFTGRGDGKCPDFMAVAKQQRTIWRDPSTK
jgi:hypothetical protein